MTPGPMEEPMEPVSSSPEPAFVADLRRRRAELLDSVRAVEQALAAPAPGREQHWAERVHVALVELDADFREHIGITEGPGGLYGQLLGTAPRLASRVDRLTREHSVITGHINDVVARASDPSAHEHVHEVRERTTALLAQLLHHRQHGSDLVFEAYAIDIGGET
jgi:hypothetical protein